MRSVEVCEVNFEVDLGGGCEVYMCKALMRRNSGMVVSVSDIHEAPFIEVGDEINFVIEAGRHIKGVWVGVKKISIIVFLSASLVFSTPGTYTTTADGGC